MQCPVCTSRATSERPERTELGYRRFRCRDCNCGFNEQSGTVFNRLQYRALRRDRDQVHRMDFIGGDHGLDTDCKPGYWRVPP